MTTRAFSYCSQVTKMTVCRNPKS